MKKIIYIILFSFLGVLVGFLIHSIIEFGMIFLLERNFEKYNLGFSWQQWFTIHTVGTTFLLFAGWLFGLSQGFLWWRILYVENRRFGHRDQAIILDFDHTIFNTTLYVQALKELFTKEFDIPADVFMENRNAVKACCEVIDMDEFIKRLPHENKKAMHEAHHQLIEDRAKEFIFSDARHFIDHHRKDFDVIILTHGDEELQSEKIEHSDIPRVSQTIISVLPKVDIIEDLLEDYKKLHFVDDKSETIDKVKTTFPQVESYFVVRPDDHPYGEQPPDCKCADHTVERLSFEISQ